MVERLNPFSVCPACGSVATWDSYKQKNICRECEQIRKIFKGPIEINPAVSRQDVLEKNASD
ncbi:MAG: hypothetical protein H6Q74_1678 [Firmicutes bacterium]|nr:hypothetical protein [Bacillota bacterium]